MDNNQGVYKIENTETGKVYVGSSTNLTARLKYHLWKLRKGKHNNHYLQKSYNKHGEPAFEFSIIEYIEYKDKLVEQEQFWIDFYKSADRDKGYNILPTSGNTNRILPQETGAKISMANKGRTLTQEQKENLSKSIKKVYEDPEMRKKYSECKQGNKNPMWGVQLSEESKRRLRDLCSKDWVVVSPNGEVFRVKSLNKFCKDKGLDRRSMGTVGKGKRPHHKGWRCKILEDYNKLTQEENIAFTAPFSKSQGVAISPIGETFIVENLTKFCKERGLCPSHLISVSNGKAKSHKGWKYEKTRKEQ